MKHTIRWILPILLLVFTGSAITGAKDTQENEIVSRSLDSIAPETARAATKSRVAQGHLKFSVLVGGSGGASGAFDLVSTGHKLNIVMQFGAGNWRGEQFIFDGSRTSVAKATSDHQYSEFGEFVASQDFMLREGLLGGEFSTGWALQNLQSNGARLENLGRKKYRGKERIALQYFSKHSTDMQVKLYFDPETNHHVATVYSMQRAPQATGDIRTSPSQREVRYTVEEQFSDFQTADGVTLPRHYDLQWTEELQTGGTRVLDFDVTGIQIKQDLALDPANFEVK